MSFRDDEITDADEAEREVGVKTGIRCAGWALLALAFAALFFAVLAVWGFYFFLQDVPA